MLLGGRAYEWGLFMRGEPSPMGLAFNKGDPMGFPSPIHSVRMLWEGSIHESDTESASALISNSPTSRTVRNTFPLSHPAYGIFAIAVHRDEDKSLSSNNLDLVGGGGRLTTRIEGWKLSGKIIIIAYTRNTEKQDITCNYKNKVRIKEESRVWAVF